MFVADERRNAIVISVYKRPVELSDNGVELRIGGAIAMRLDLLSMCGDGRFGAFLQNLFVWTALPGTTSLAVAGTRMRPLTTPTTQPVVIESVLMRIEDYDHLAEPRATDDVASTAYFTTGMQAVTSVLLDNGFVAEQGLYTTLEKLADFGYIV